MDDDEDSSPNFNGLEQMEREEKEKLEKQEIDKARELINRRYPLNNLGITDVFTIFRPLLFWRKANEAKKESERFKKGIMSEAISKSLLRKPNLNLDKVNTALMKSQKGIIEDSMIHQEEKINNDPLNLLGIGIVAQFNLMLYLILAFVIFSLLAIPMINIYSGYSAMKGTKKEAYTDSTLGNLGFSSSA